MTPSCKVHPFEPQLPEGCDLFQDRILLHCCCAPCSAAILEWMISQGLKPVLFFSNSNIVPEEEYILRRDELKGYAASFGCETYDDVYDHQDWLQAVKGLEHEPERGKRCTICFRYRLFRAAAFASRQGCRLLTTTLASSRWKNLQQVDEAGQWAVSSFPEVAWWNQNWRKGGLQERRNAIIKECGLYNQNFCGCEFSHGF